MAEIVRIIHDVDFAVMDEPRVTETDIEYGLVDKHGTIIIVRDIVEGDPDALWTFGAEDGSTEFRVAFYKPFCEMLRVQGKIIP